MQLILAVLTTPRLALRPFRDDEARAVVSGDVSGLTPGEGWPHADTVDGLAMAIAGGHPPGWLVLLDGAVIGDGGLHGVVDSGGAVEIGYGVAAPFRGLGYGSEVVKAIADWLLVQPAVHFVHAHTLIENSASRRVLEKAAFRHVSDADGQAHYVRNE